MIELENLLHEVNGTYKDFEKWLISIAKEHDNLNLIKQYIQDNTEATDEDIIDFVEENCEYTNNNDEIPEWAQEDEE